MTAPSVTEPSDTALEVSDLVVTYKAHGESSFNAVDGVSFTVAKGETVGVVGESGSGKSTIGRAILGLVRAADGTVRINGEDVTMRAPKDQRRIARILQVVFQDPFSSLNPARTVGKTLTEPLEVQQKTSSAVALNTVNDLLASVGLPSDAANRYPHNFSGGQRQRIAIARSLATTPELVVCDEAVSALDLVTRAQVLNLLADIQAQRKLSYLFIAHDLPIVTYLSHRVVVLYRGRIMEQGDAQDIERRPLHPYTQALLTAVPVPNPAAQATRRELRHATIGVSTAKAKPAPKEGCPFAPRCPSAADVCWSVRPKDTPVVGRLVACHLYDSASGHPEAGGAATSTALGELTALSPTARAAHAVAADAAQPAASSLLKNTSKGLS